MKIKVFKEDVLNPVLFALAGKVLIDPKSQGWHFEQTIRFYVGSVVEVRDGIPEANDVISVINENTVELLVGVTDYLIASGVDLPDSSSLKGHLDPDKAEAFRNKYFALVKASYLLDTLMKITGSGKQELGPEFPLDIGIEKPKNGPGSAFFG